MELRLSDPQPFQLGSLAKSSDGIRHYVGRTLSGRVVLDNASFRDCIFREAVLVFSGLGPTQITGCSFRDVEFAFEGPASLTLAFLKAMAQSNSGLRDVVKASFPQMFGH